MDLVPLSGGGGLGWAPSRWFWVLAAAFLPTSWRAHRRDPLLGDPYAGNWGKNADVADFSSIAMI